MDLYYNEQKLSQLPIVPQTTVGQIKKTLNDWLVPQGVTNYTIRIFFNNGTELSNVVFQTNTYDAVNFESQAALIKGGSVRVNQVTKVPETKETKIVEVKKEKEEEEDEEKEEEEEKEDRGKERISSY